MSDEKERRASIIDTSDCLEAVDVFRGWKNFLFWIVLLSLLMLQAAFWLVDIGYVKISEPGAGAAAQEAVTPAVPAVQPVAEPNKPAAAEQSAPVAKEGFQIKFEQLSWLIRLLNFIVVPAAVLYCLTLLCGLSVSLIGRLGGISHITKAFFLSLLMLILMLPWQRVFWGVVVGAMYTPEGLLSSMTITPASDNLGAIIHYLRFTVYWLVVVLLLIFAQLRSGKWARAMLRRLEVV